MADQKGSLDKDKLRKLLLLRGVAFESIRGLSCAGSDGKSGRHMGGKDSASEVSIEGDKTGSSKLLKFQEFKKVKRGGGRIRTAE